MDETRPPPLPAIASRCIMSAFPREATHMKRATLLRFIVAALPLSFLSQSALSQSDVAGFYRGKTVKIGVGLGAGGSFDITARAVARHIGREIPGNPTVIVENVPGAGSMLAL